MGHLKLDHFYTRWKHGSKVKPTSRGFSTTVNVQLSYNLGNSDTDRQTSPFLTLSASSSWAPGWLAHFCSGHVGSHHTAQTCRMASAKPPSQHSQSWVSEDKTLSTRRFHWIPIKWSKWLGRKGLWNIAVRERREQREHQIKSENIQHARHMHIYRMINYQKGLD